MVERTAREPEWTEPEPGDPQVQRRFCVIPELNGRVLRVACAETEAHCLLPLGPQRAAKTASMDFRYDSEADGLMIELAEGDYDESEEVHPGVVLDFDKQGRILRIEVLSATKALAPGAWSEASEADAKPQTLQAAE